MAANGAAAPIAQPIQTTEEAKLRAAFLSSWSSSAQREAAFEPARDGVLNVTLEQAIL